VRELALPLNHPFGGEFLKKEWPFLCACAAPVPEFEHLRERLGAGLNWDVLLRLAEEHGVLGLLAKRLEQTGHPDLPPSIGKRLQSRMRAQHLFSLSMTADLYRLLEEFLHAGIETILVKGPLLSLLAYGDPGLRSYVDLDLLVQHEDIGAATERMQALGYQSELPRAAIAAGRIPGEYLFRQPDTMHLVELHTERSFRYYPKPMRIAELFQRKRSVVLDGREVPGLGLEDEFVLNCVHGAKHFWERLMWVADVSALVENHPEMNWNLARHAAADVAAGRMLHMGVQLGAVLFGGQIPAELAREVERDREAMRLCRRVEGWLPFAGYRPPSLRERAFFRAKMAGGGATGLGYLLRLSLSPTEEDWKPHADQTSSKLRDVLRRPMRLYRKYGRDRGQE